MYVLAWLLLDRADVLMHRSFKVDGIQMSLHAIAWLTYMQSVGALRMFGECSTRCHLEMWSLGMPWYWDMWNVADQQMEHEGVQPDSVTVVGVRNACASMVAIEEGRCVHQQIIESGMESAVFVGSSLVDMYAKCGSIEDAWRVFNKMPSRDVVTWTGILGGCAMHGHGRETLKHFEWMCEEGVQPNDITFLCVLSACNHAGLVDEGMCLYASMVTDYIVLQN
jgi:pentatricopeptide repeat protein